MRFMMLVATDPEGEPYSADQDNVEEWGNERDRVEASDGEVRATRATTDLASGLTVVGASN